MHAYSTEGWTTGLNAFLKCRLFLFEFLSSVFRVGSSGVKRLMFQVPVVQRTGHGLL